MSNREQRVREELDRRRIAAYLPTYREKRRWADRDKTLDVPLFRGYVFARIERTPEARVEVLMLSGATRIVGAVTETEIESVKKMLESGGKPYASANPLLKVGCRVRVRSGSLRGVEGIFLRQKAQGRLIVSIDLLRQGVSAEMDEADVEVLP
jgi:transcription antitermination factor NusG